MSHQYGSRWVISASASVSVQPGGKPINHSTQSGLSCAPACTKSLRLLVLVRPAASSASGDLPPFYSRDVGVGIILTTAFKSTCTFLPLWYAVRPLCQSSTCFMLRPPLGTVGVGHICTNLPNPIEPSVPCWLIFRYVPFAVTRNVSLAPITPPCAPSLAVGVDNNCDSVPSVIGPDATSRKYK